MHQSLQRAADLGHPRVLLGVIGRGQARKGGFKDRVIQSGMIKGKIGLPQPLPLWIVLQRQSANVHAWSPLRYLAKGNLTNASCARGGGRKNNPNWGGPSGGAFAAL